MKMCGCWMVIALTDRAEAPWQACAPRADRLTGDAPPPPARDLPAASEAPPRLDSSSGRVGPSSQYDPLDGGVFAVVVRARRRPYPFFFF